MCIHIIDSTIEIAGVVIIKSEKLVNAISGAIISPINPPRTPLKNDVFIKLFLL